MIEESIKVCSWEKKSDISRRITVLQGVFIYPGTIDVYDLISTDLSIISKD